MVVLVVVTAVGLSLAILVLRDLIVTQARDRAAEAARHVAEQITTERYPDGEIPASEPIPRLQIVDGETGEVLAASHVLQGVPALSREEPRRGDFRTDSTTCADYVGESPADCYLVVGYSIVDSAYGDVMVLAAARSPYVLGSGALETVLIGSAAGVLTATGLIIWVGVGRALRPVEQISDQMEAISVTDLQRRLRVPGTHDEIAHLARTANASLDRLEEAVTRQRRFVSDASHELRNPIAGMRAKLEVELSEPEPDPRTRDRLLTALLADTERLENIVTDLLELARLDSDLASSREPLDLAALVRQEFGARTDVADLHIHTRGEVPVRMDRLRTARVLTNLVANAERHAHERIDIVVDLDERGDAVVEVHDDGSGVPEADRERIFERFSRLRESRDLDPGGSGLGLAISREIVKAYGGTLTAGHSELLGGALFTLRIPPGCGDGGAMSDGGELSAAGEGAGAVPLPAGRRPGYFRIGFVGALGVLVAWLLVQSLVGVRGVLVYILVALFLAVGLNPVIEFLRDRARLPRWAAILAVCAALVAFVAVFVWAIVPPLGEQVTGLVSGLPTMIGDLQGNAFFADLDRRYDVLDKLQGAVTDPDVGRQVFGGLVGVGQVVVDSLVASFTVFILTLFFMASLHGILDACYRLVPRSRRAGVREIGDEIVQRIGAFIAGQLVVAAFSGLVAFLFLWAIGSAYALTLALVVAVTALIPLVGTTIGALAASLAVAVSDPWLGLLTLVFFLVYQQIESYVISPRVMSRAVHVSPTANITAALVGGAMLGLVGALLAIPVAASLTIILHKVVFPRLEEA